MRKVSVEYVCIIMGFVKGCSVKLIRLTKIFFPENFSRSCRNLFVCREEGGCGDSFVSLALALEYAQNSRSPSGKKVKSSRRPGRGGGGQLTIYSRKGGDFFFFF